MYAPVACGIHVLSGIQMHFVAVSSVLSHVYVSFDLILCFVSRVMQSCVCYLVLVSVHDPCIDLSGDGEVHRGPRRKGRGSYRHPGGMRCMG